VETARHPGPSGAMTRSVSAAPSCARYGHVTTTRSCRNP
jgi:hypothetical protein